jgi:hypothetical protein
MAYFNKHINGITMKRYEPDYQPVDIPWGMNLELALWSYESFNRRWKESVHRAYHIELFKNIILKLESQQITSCLAIGLGTFTSSNPYGSADPESSLLPYRD